MGRTRFSHRRISGKRYSNMLYHAAFEPMENRRMMSLLGITPGYPQLTTTQTGTVNYTYDSTTATGTFDLSSAPFQFKASASSPTETVFGPSEFQIQFKTDGNGNVIGGISGADFIVTGTIDSNNDRRADAGDISGTLLTGEIDQFGYQYTGIGTNSFDFRFNAAGGLLVSDYPAQFANSDIGVSMSSEDSTYNGSFMQNFTGLVKATAGPIPAPAGGPVIPSIDTTPGPSVLLGSGNHLSDSATLSGGDSPTGSITYYLFAPGVTPNATDSNNVYTNTVTISGDGTYNTSTGTNPGGYQPTSTGTYQWIAIYSGDLNNSSVGSNQDLGLEPETVTPATPAINTAQQPDSAIVGSSIADQATVSGGYNPTGTVTFNLYNNPNGTGTPLFTDANEPLTGGVATSSGYIATATATDYWVATYNGDSNNSSVTSGTADEPVSVTAVSPAISTAATVSNGGIVGSAFLSDVATLSGGYNPTGTITFTLTTPDGTVLPEGSVNVTGDNTYNSPSVLATEVGNYMWHATYSGDTNNAGASDNGVNEGVTTTQASPAINTAATVSNGGIVGSAFLSDVATLSGGYSPTGTITFTLTTPDGTVLPEGSVTVTGDNTYNSPSVLATEVGNYMWHATYGGDTNNNGASDNGVNEGVTTTQASPAINTAATVSNGGIVGNAFLSDVATLSGGYSPTGTITFTLTTPDGTVLPEGSVNVTGDNTYNSTSVLATEVGNYMWHATYSGDTNNTGASDNGVNEGVTTTQASPAINTAATVSNGGIVGSAFLSDVATLSGGYNPTGTITFTLTTPDGTVLPEGSVTVTGDNTYNSPSVLATEVGNYMWHATYSGDTNNTGASDNGVNEGVTTTKASPAINTVGSVTNGGIVGSAFLSDAATLSGGYNVTGGTITFSLTAPDGTTTTVGSVPVTSNGTYDSIGVLATEVGTYTWYASYSGDGLNLSSTDNGTNESVTTTPASPAINTAATVSNGGIVGSAFLADVATLSGGYNPTGTITFTLTTPDGTVLPEGSVTVTGDNTYNSPSVLATEVGNYMWHATYSGDTNNTGASDNGVNEGVTTTKASPAINTVGSETGNGIVGITTLSDNATISGGYSVSGGTITFTVTNPDGSTSSVGTVNVTGNGTYPSPGFTATQVGTYTFHATYSGDGLNLSSTDNGVNESVSVSKASPAITTSATESNGGIVGSAMLCDSATISGGYNVSGGSITFTLTAPDGTTSTVGTVSVSAAGTYKSTMVTATEVGTYTWHASYNGDGLNNGAIDNGTNESVTTTKASPAINTVGSETGNGIVGNTTLSDNATISGGYNVSGGTITFTVTNPDGSTSNVGTVNVTGNGTYASPGFIATQFGTYTFHATYSGNGLNLSSTDNGTNESVVVSKAAPAINTQQQPASAVVGSSIADKATVSGGYNPTGTVTFDLYSNSTGTGTPLFVSSPIALVGGVATSPGYTATATATDYWVATYNGDSNNSAVTSGTALEPVSITKASPAINTQQQPASAVVGSSIADKATVSGGYNPTGTVTFKLYNNSTASGTPLVTDSNVALVAGVATSPGYTATATGTDYWVATYNGDTNNSSVTSGTALEPVSINKATPTITTTAKETGNGMCGSTTISDSAVVAGGYNPTGTVTFTLTSPSNTVISTQTVTITGDGTYAPTAVSTTAVGTYTWKAVYNGDTNNVSVSDQGGTAEQVTIGKNTPTVVTTASTKSGTGLVVGTAIPEDSAVVSGGDSPTGNLVFTLKAPNGTVADTQTIAITGDGTFTTTNTAVATQVGTYTWTVSYAGDTLNNSANDQGGSAEQVVVAKATPTITTTASFKTGCGNMLGSGVPEDSAVVAGGDVPSGSLTFTLTAPNGSVVDTQIVNITGDGTYATTNTVAATQSGTYTWSVTYNGNSLNNSAQDQGGAAEQLVIASGSISGTKFNDVTGNGLSSDDTPLSGVTIELFKSGSSTVIASAVTDSNGNYSFTGLAAGSYVVEEVVPTGWTQTGPVSGSYNVTLSSTTLTSTGNNFDDFMSSCCNTADFTNVSFVIQDASGVKTVSDLRGNTNQGDEVTAYFDYTGTTAHPVTFVTYTAPDNYWNANDASTQQEFQVVTILAQPGENSISVQIPNCNYQIDLVCGYAINQLGPAGSNIFYSAQGRLISADNDGTEAQASAFGQVNGNVYLDLNNNGVKDSNEVGIGGVTVDLTGTDSHGTAVSLLRVTNADGSYSFQGLQPGTYSVKEITPAGYLDGKDTLGTGAAGTVSNDLFSNLKIVAGTNGINYNYGELPAKACSGVTGSTATCTFWNGTSGQGLICSFGGSSSDCTLGNWLASCYPNLYGSACGTNCLSGKTNAQVCTYFQGLYKTSSSKTACEVLAACLNLYATDASLGGLCGAAYGFSVQCDGAACTTYSVGTNGSCFGVSNNTKCSLSDLIDACNSKSSKGSLFGGNSSNSNSCYTVLSGINGW